MNRKIIDHYFLILFAHFVSLSVFLFAFPFPFTAFLALLLMAIIAGGYIYFDKWKHKDKRMKHIWPIILGVLIVVMIPFFMEAIHAYYNVMTEAYTKSSVYVFPHYTLTMTKTEVSFIMLLLFLIISTVQLLVLDYTLVKRKRLFVSFLVTLLPILPTLLYSLPQPWLLTGLLFAFWVYLLFLSFAKRHDAYIGLYQKPFIFLLAFCELFTVSFLVLYPETSYKQSSSSLSVRQKLLQSIDNLFYDLNYGSGKVGKIDLGKAGDRYYTGAVQLNVELKNPEALYLKTYSGANYQENAWDSLEESFYEEAESIEWDRIPVWLSSHKYARITSTRHVKIYDQRGTKDYAITPYDTVLNTAASEMYPFYDAYYMYADEGEHATEISDFVIGASEAIGDINDAKKDQYYEFVKKNYTNLDQRTSDMVRDLHLKGDDNFIKTDESGNRVTDQQAVIDYVKDYMNRNTSYTLKPGKTPRDKDFVEYFLKENKRGYCVHYATAATVILRSYGIPTRYAEGFYVDESLFFNGEASVPDRSAHAWIEVFDPSRGWQPVEVTPSSADNPVRVTPEEQQPQQTPQEEQPQEPQTPEETPKTPQEEQPNLTNQELHRQEDEAFKIPVAVKNGILILCILALPYLQRKVRYGIRLLFMHHMNRKKAVRSIYRYALKASLYGVDVPKAFKTTYEKALFSRHSITNEEYKAFYHAVQNNVNTGMKRMSKKQKRRFKYFRAMR